MAANILLAEDDRALSALILDFFHAAGLEVLPVFDGEQALAAAAEQSFDLLILDVMMPHFSGLEVCRRVREDSSVPILFITALSQEENALAGFRAFIPCQSFLITCRSIFLKLSNNRHQSFIRNAV